MSSRSRRSQPSTSTIRTAREDDTDEWLEVDNPPQERREVFLWALLVALYRRTGFKRKLWSFLGQHLKDIKARGVEDDAKSVDRRRRFR